MSKFDTLPTTKEELDKFWKQYHKLSYKEKVLAIDKLMKIVKRHNKG